ncbi:MAG: GAF domain-containing protein [Anaerolineae bacterium]|nr:GAF domain-containing protein [Anaerolineae bacterium]
MTSPTSPVTPNSNGGILDVIKRLNSQTERLELALEQTLQALRKRGFQLSTDLGGMASGLHGDIMTVQKAAESMNAKQQQMQELIRILGLINSSLDMEQVLQDVMDTVISLTGAERAYLLMRREGSSELSIRQARNWDQETLADNEVVFSRSIINRALEMRAPILTTNASDDYGGAQSVMAYSLRSVVCIPLLLRDQVIGVLYADNRLGQGVFSQDSIPLLEAFANQAAIAIENARAFAQVKKDLDQAQSELKSLLIQIDQKKMQEQLGEITESEYFQTLQSKVAAMRNRSRRSETSSD